MKQMIVFLAALFIYNNTFSQPKPSSFNKAFKIIEPSIAKNFVDITGKEIGNTAWGNPISAITIKDLPGTLPNYIEFITGGGYGPDTYYYTAPIDITSNKENIAAKMLQWKQLIEKAFRDESKSMKEENSSYAYTYTITHRANGIKWNIIIRSKKDNNRLDLIIEEAW